MHDYHVAVIPGDGIGQEVTPEGVRVLDVVGQLTGAYKMRYDYFPWGCEYYLKTGRMMAEDGLKTLKEFDIIYFGAVGFPSVPDHISLRGLRLPICQGFEQYVCQRPSYLLPGIKSPLADKASKVVESRKLLARFPSTALRIDSAKNRVIAERDASLRSA